MSKTWGGTVIVGGGGVACTLVLGGGLEGTIIGGKEDSILVLVLVLVEVESLAEA